MQQRLETHPEMRRTRQAMVEHPCATITRGMEQRDFLMRGKKHVSTDMRLRMLAYHITRVLNLLGVKAMIAAFACNGL